ncbi:hypothetical protein AK830_g935 [Neonectria ditissima]|uniref:4-coumarate--CoA ligase-like 7 n=1 Tax=Neonectria ditissima TaxID=78410 RepID=A0A0P7BK33_9HYPO|nr:hypothetical protein AK830_g935 [Neonectria ditissima]
MTYFGPHLQPVPTDVSVWSWLFGSALSSRKGTPQETPQLSNDRGFRDATTGRLLTYQEARDHATWLSIALAQLHGLKAHQTVAIVSPNSISCPIAMFAAGRLGAIVTTLPHEANAKDLSYFFQASSTVLVFTSESAVGQVRKACKTAGLADERIICLSNNPQMTSIQGLIEYGKNLGPAKFVEEWTPVDKTSATCAFLYFTSGTTGRPKAVRHPKTAFLGCKFQKGSFIQLCQMRQLSPRLKQNTVLGILPFYHITGLVHLIHLPVVLEQDIVIMDKFDMRKMLNTVVKYRCNELWVVPPLLIRLLNDSVVKEYNLSFVDQFNTGAAPLAEKIIAQLSARFPHVAIRQAWGMTESTSCLTLTPPGLATWENATKVGRIVAGTEIRFVDPETKKDVAVGESGEVRGFGIAPAELEDLLLGHAKVRDAAIVGIPDDYSGEVPRAYIVLHPGVRRGEETERALKEHVKSHKARHKWLAGGVEFVDAIPKSASGKILRKSLKAKWQEKLEAEKRDSAKL